MTFNFSNPLVKHVIQHIHTSTVPNYEVRSMKGHYNVDNIYVTKMTAVHGNSLEMSGYELAYSKVHA